MLRKQTNMARSLLAAWEGVLKLVFEGTRDLY